MVDPLTPLTALSLWLGSLGLSILQPLYKVSGAGLYQLVNYLISCYLLCSTQGHLGKCRFLPYHLQSLRRTEGAIENSLSGFCQTLLLLDYGHIFCMLNTKTFSIRNFRNKPSPLSTSLNLSVKCPACCPTWMTTQRVKTPGHTQQASSIFFLTARLSPITSAEASPSCLKQTYSPLSSLHNG